MLDKQKIPIIFFFCLAVAVFFVVFIVVLSRNSQKTADAPIVTTQPTVNIPIATPSVQIETINNSQIIENKKWEDKRNDVLNKINSLNALKVNTENGITEMKAFLNTLYFTKCQQCKSVIAPLIALGEQNIITSEKLLLSISVVNSIRQQELTAIDQRNEVVFNSLYQEEISSLKNQSPLLDQMIKENSDWEILKETTRAKIGSMMMSL